MKKVKIFGYAYLNGEMVAESRDFTNAWAFSNWANKQFKKYGDAVKVYEYNMDENFDVKLVSTWGA